MVILNSSLANYPDLRSQRSLKKSNTFAVEKIWNHGTTCHDKLLRSCSKTGILLLTLFFSTNVEVRLKVCLFFLTILGFLSFRKVANMIIAAVVLDLSNVQKIIVLSIKSWVLLVSSVAIPQNQNISFKI